MKAIEQVLIVAGVLTSMFLLSQTALADLGGLIRTGVADVLFVVVALSMALTPVLGRIRRSAK